MPRKFLMKKKDIEYPISECRLIIPDGKKEWYGFEIPNKKGEKNMVEKIGNLTDMMLFWLGCSGKEINWRKVTKRYGKETANRLKKEIEVCLSV